MANQEIVLSASNIKYLLTIYSLCKKNSGIKCVRIAELLDITKPSVHKMINTLKDMGLVEKSPYGKVFFTNDGLKIAIKYDRYYKSVSGLLKTRISDENDIRNASCALLAEVSEKGLKKFCVAGANKKSEEK